MSAAQFLEIVISLSLQAAIVVLLTSWACRLVRTPSLQCRLWNLCHIVLLGLTAAALLLPHPRFLRPWRLVSTETVGRVASAESVVGRGALWIWAAGAASSLAILMYHWFRAARFLKSCRDVDWPAHRLADLMGENGDGEKDKTRPRVLVSPEIGSPFCCQWHQPYLVLPEFLEDSSTDALRFVARHELEHLRGGHPLHLFLQRLVETVFWFHPLVRWASREMALAREFACDDAAVSSRRDVIVYLKMLLAIAERGQVCESEGALLFFGRSASIVARRGRRLVEQLEQGRTVPSSRARIASQALVGLASLVSVAAWAPCDVLASGRMLWSPWPSWSAGVLHSFEIPARDYEPFESRTRLYELEERAAAATSR